MDEKRGASLKKVRLQKGVTLEQAQKDTRIHLHILRALEGDGITDISQVYLKSFLNLYCKYLGVAPQDYVDDYRQTQYTVDLEQQVSVPREKGEKKSPRASRPRQKLDIKKYIPGKALKKTGQLMKSAQARVSSIKISQELKMGIVSVCILILLVVGLIKLGQVATRKVKGFIAKRRSAVTQIVQPPAQKPERGVVEASVPAPKVATSAVVKPQAGSEAKQESPIKLVIRAQQNCWVFLKADGDVVFQRILEKGRFESWQAEDKMELSLGNAGGVENEVNGQLFKNLGRNRQAIKNIVITKEGMQVN